MGDGATGEETGLVRYGLRNGELVLVNWCLTLDRCKLERKRERERVCVCVYLFWISARRACDSTSGSSYNFEFTPRLTRIRY